VTQDSGFMQSAKKPRPSSVVHFHRKAIHRRVELLIFCKIVQGVFRAFGDERLGLLLVYPVNMFYCLTAGSLEV